MPALKRMMTWDEIVREFPDEWVLVADPDLGPGPNIEGGLVVYHSEDVNEVSAFARQMHYRFEAMLFTGEVPELVRLT